jgi:polyphosphate glucokinase
LQVTTELVLGLDVGGSSIKAGAVDLLAGRLASDLISEPTPQPSDPAHLVGALARLAARLPQARGSVGVAFPSVVKRGQVRTAANIDHAWIGTDGAALVARTLERPAAFLNDADAAGLAEIQLGAGKGVMGSVVMITLGTGIGTALFIGGRLFPNTELGHLELHGSDAEKWASAHVRTALNLDWSAWTARVNDYLARLEAYLWPDLIIIGGAVSKEFANFAPLLRTEAEVRAAHFTGEAGVMGAALATVHADTLKSP